MVQSDKMNPRLDEEIMHELQPLLRSTQAPHLEEFRQVEPSGEDQPEVSIDPTGSLMGSVPEGMSAQEVDQRSQLAACLGKEIWPARPSLLVSQAENQNAPDWILVELQRLPDGEYENVAHVWTALGHEVEHVRF